RPVAPRAPERLQPRNATPPDDHDPRRARDDQGEPRRGVLHALEIRAPVDRAHPARGTRLGGRPRRRAHGDIGASLTAAALRETAVCIVRILNNRPPIPRVYPPNGSRLAKAHPEAEFGRDSRAGTTISVPGLGPCDGTALPERALTPVFECPRRRVGCRVLFHHPTPALPQPSLLRPR